MKKAMLIKPEISKIRFCSVMLELVFTISESWVEEQLIVTKEHSKVKEIKEQSHIHEFSVLLNFL